MFWTAVFFAFAQVPAVPQGVGMNVPPEHRYVVPFTYYAQEHLVHPSADLGWSGPVRVYTIQPQIVPSARLVHPSSP